MSELLFERTRFELNGMVSKTKVRVELIPTDRWSFLHF